MHKFLIQIKCNIVFLYKSKYQFALAYIYLLCILIVTRYRRDRGGALNQIKMAHGFLQMLPRIA